MSHETLKLVQYARALRYEDIPDDVLVGAKQSIIDGIGCCVFGSRLPWSQTILRYLGRIGAPGRSAILGPGIAPLEPPLAAAANGAMAHSFELDSGLRPGVGAHPFPAVFTSALAVAQDRKIGGRDVMTAFVAGSEVMLRIGSATGRTNEDRGFHAPGTTGPFGGAIACGLLLGFDETTMLNAMGIAGSLACGLRQFNVSDTGGMVKRLHFARGAEGGVMAANLAAEGFDGPHDILEGKAGFLAAFCNEHDVGKLTQGLDNKTYLMRRLAIKRFATHAFAQFPLQALQQIRDRHPFKADEIESIRVAASHDQVEFHDSFAPTDLMQAQYSVPFCVALGCVRDAFDPRSFDDSALNDPAIRAMIKRVRYDVTELGDRVASEVTVTLRSGAVHSLTLPEPGTSWAPATQAEVEEKYAMLMRDLPKPRTDELLARVLAFEKQPDMDWLRLE